MGPEELMIADRDYVRLVPLAGEGALADELERATVIPLERMPQEVVRMHSRVTYDIEGSTALRQVQLVYPDEADPAAGKVSVLAPVGAALLGLQEGQTIDWPFFPDGRLRRLRVVRAEPPTA
ncbi:MAG: GreA/GreB family elongation factor [Betaproteobacteria bacterium]